jgi:RNA polymerase sigma-70 factor (ECF subfamily)
MACPHRIAILIRDRGAVRIGDVLGLRNEAGAQARLDRLADEELMPLVAGADADAFRVVLERHGDAAFSLAYRMCGRSPLAEDVTQEAMLTVWRRASAYDSGRGSLRTWILTIVHNRAIDVLRGAARHTRRAARVEEGTDAIKLPSSERTDAEAIGNVEADSLRSALELLPDAQRQAIELAYYGGFSQSEIADMLGEPLGTIKGRLRIGLGKLRDHCDPWAAAA